MDCVLLNHLLSSFLRDSFVSTLFIFNEIILLDRSTLYLTYTFNKINRLSKLSRDTILKF